MTRILLILIATVQVSFAAPDGWELVWSDEFDRDGAPDASKWTYEVGYIRNNESQYYTEDRLENARVADGHLIIEARKEDFPLTGKPRNKGRDNAAITSASLTSEGKASWTYGRIEVSARLPEGRGVWPAIWMLGTNRRDVGWPTCGEIDIMEFVGYDPGVIHANVHTRDHNHTKRTGRGDKIEVPDASDVFHTYAVEWTETEMRFFVDGDCYFTCKNDGKGIGSWPFDAPQYLILNLAVGGAWGGQKGIDDSIFPQRMVIDHVRVYRRKD